MTGTISAEYRLGPLTEAAQNRCAGKGRAMKTVAIMIGALAVALPACQSAEVPEPGFDEMNVVPPPVAPPQMQVSPPGTPPLQPTGVARHVPPPPTPLIQIGNAPNGLGSSQPQASLNGPARKKDHPGKKTNVQPKASEDLDKKVVTPRPAPATPAQPVAKVPEKKDPPAKNPPQKPKDKKQEERPKDKTLKLGKRNTDRLEKLKKKMRPMLRRRDKKKAE